VLTSADFRDLTSGRRRGLRASLWRFAFRIAAVPYSWVVRWRNRRYDRGTAEVHRLAVPVVSVGNLTLGGTGKTPMVEWVARWFRKHGVRVTIVSRGYGAEAGALNDEAMELEQRLPDVPHVQDPDRVAAAEMAIEEFDCQVIVLDDAFQHRRIGRDLDLVMLDALEPFGYGRIFPAGRLREPVAGLRRAQVVALSRADMVDPAERERIRREVARHAPDAAWAEVVHAPRALVDHQGRKEPLDSLAGKPVAAFCGLGNPDGFRRTLEKSGYQVIAFREYADHYRYTRTDVESLAAWADAQSIHAVVCAHKDLVKLGVDRLGSRPVRAVTIALEFLSGQQELEARLGPLLPRGG
jgi:tetraacyldisaccharide 4'-kinase